jgi:predicted transcriptional regulator YdeE
MNMMQPTFTHIPALLLAGMSFYGDPFDTSDVWMEENQIGRTWQRLMAYLGQHGHAIQGIAAPGVLYEVHIYGDETPSNGHFEVFVGLPVEHLENVPVELLVKILPAGEHAVFTLAGQAIAADWAQEMHQAIAKAGCERSQPYTVQVYDERFKGLDQLEDSVLAVYIPIRRA